MSGAGLVARRALTQLPLLAAVLAVLVAGAGVAGACALLLTDAGDAAVVAAVRAAPADDVRLTVTFRVTGGTSDEARARTDPATPDGPVATAAAEAAGILAPLGSTTSAWYSSPPLPLAGRSTPLPGAADDDPGQAYLLAADDVADHAELVAGRWPQGRAGGAWETALPRTSADALGVGVGDEVRLAAGDDDAGDDDAAGGGLTLAVVGVFEPVRPHVGAWTRDVLEGVGYDAAWIAPGEGGRAVPTAGPLVVDAAAFGAVVPADRVSLWLDPDVSAATPERLAEVRAGLAGVNRRFADLLGGEATTVVAASRLPRTIAGAHAQQEVTGDVVRVVGVVTVALAAVALGLAGRLLVVRRAGLAALLVARGARRSQLVAQAAGEAAVLAVVGGALAVPVALAAYRALLRAPEVAAAGLPATARADGTLVAACVGTAALLGLALVLPWLGRRDRARRRTGRGRRQAVARSGADLAALALAVAAYLQLRRHLLASEGGTDPVLVAAPVVCLLAASLLALRVVPLVERLAETRAARSRRLVLPLAEWQVARRPHSAPVAFLLVLATAAATFATAFAATWAGSQRDQADARVGADVAVLPAADGLPGGEVVAAASGAEPVPVSLVQVGLGVDVAGRGSAATLVAFDTRRADVVRGRLDGSDWPTTTADMAPEPVTGLPVRLDDTGRAEGVTVTASLSRDVPGLRVAPTLVLVDAWGGRTVLRGEPVPADGTPRPFVVAGVDTPFAGVPDGDLTLLAVHLEARRPPDPGELAGTVDLDAAVSLPGREGPAPSRWYLRQDDPRWPWFEHGEVEVDAGTVHVTGRVELGGLWGDPGVVASPFPSGAVVPLAVTQDIAQALSLEPGAAFAVDVSGVRVPGRVAAVVPYVPAAPTASAILVDEQALTGALVVGGALRPLTQRWWVPTDDPGATADLLADAGLVVQDRTEVAAALRAGPLRVGVVAALLLLVVAAVALALAGTGLDTAATLEPRAVEVARLLGLGVSRRAVFASLMAEHAAVSTVVVAAGVGVGAVVARLLTPLLPVSESGQAPVPPAVPVWPWPAQAALVAVLLVGAAAVAAPAAGALVRRAVAAHLRVGDP